jgi:hypothetical protein
MGLGGKRHALAALSPGKTRCPFYRGLGGSQGWFGRMWKILPSHRDSIPGPSSRYTDCAIPAYKISEIPGKILNVMLERVEKINWSDLVRNEEVLRFAKDRNNLRTAKRTEADWIGHTLCRNCLLKHVIEGKIAGRM